MSKIEYLTTTFDSLLSKENNIAISINGEWGSGKTWFWHHYISDKKHSRLCNNKKYCYVSLFGISNIEQLKQAIFERIINIENAGDTTTLNSILFNLSSILYPIPDIGDESNHSVFYRTWKLSLRYAKKLILPLTGLLSFIKMASYTPLLKNSLYLLTNDVLICFDDLERKGDELTLKEIFGLATELKEQRNCSVVFISNKAKINANEDYKKYSGKSLDYEFNFDQDINDAFDIIFNPNQHFKVQLYEQLKKDCTVLKIKNIRLLRKIFNYNEMFEALCEPYHNSLYSNAAHCIPLIVALETQTSNSTTNYRYPESYNWAGEDQLYYEIKSMIRNGFPDYDEFTKILGHSDALLKLDISHQQIQDVWAEYSNNFSGEQQQIITLFETVYLKNMQLVTFDDINSLSSLFHALHRYDEAQGIIHRYIEFNRDKIESYSIDDVCYNLILSTEKDLILFKQIIKIMYSSSIHCTIEKAISYFTCTDGGTIGNLFHELIPSDDLYDFFKYNDSEIMSDIRKLLNRPDRDFEKSLQLDKKIILVLIKLSNESDLAKYKMISRGFDLDRFKSEIAELSSEIQIPEIESSDSEYESTKK